MSQENVDLVKRAFDAFNRLGQTDDPAALVDEFFDADVFWEGADEAPDRGPFRGRDQVLAHMRSWHETLDAFHSEPEEIIDAGEKVVVVQYSHGILKGSDAEVAVRFASVYEVRGGRIVSLKQYQQRAEALEAVRLEG